MGFERRIIERPSCGRPDLRPTEPSGETNPSSSAIKSRCLLEHLLFNNSDKNQPSFYGCKIAQKIGDKYGVNYDVDNHETYDAVGCEYCNNSGYYGRIGVFEVLKITDEIKELIVDSASTMEIRRKALEGDYRPLIVDGIQKVINGETNLEELNKKLLVYNNL